MIKRTKFQQTDEKYVGDKKEKNQPKTIRKMMLKYEYFCTLTSTETSFEFSLCRTARFETMPKNLVDKI